jgi:non-specific serine/threonine protein kinase
VTGRDGTGSALGARDVGAFAALLRRNRVAAGLSQEALAERSALSVRGVSDLERGLRRSPHPSTVARLADALGLDPTARAALIASAQPGQPEIQPAPPPSHLAAPLPGALTTFVGRQRELSQVRELLLSARLVSLLGTGGVGKTRLALETASAVAVEGIRTVAFCELAPLADGASVPQAVALALGVTEQPGRPVPDTLADAIGRRPMLLVLDNCEHVVAACARLADHLLRACPALQILATSREPLGVSGEVRWRVPSLSVPEPSTSVAGIASVESVELFVERARAAAPGFSVDDSNAAALAELCRRLDGIPLALELAAPVVRVLSVDQIRSRLDDRFRLLVDGNRAALPRQRTLEATLDWSHQLLDSAEQIVLRRLSVFAGGWSVDAAEAIAAGEPVAPGEVLSALTSLVDKSLVMAELEPDGSEARYHLLETIRHYAAGRLRDADEATDARDRHLAWATWFAEHAAPHLVGQDQLHWLRRIALEHDNLRAALDWSRTQAEGDAELRLAAALGRYWHLHGPSSEGRRWLRHALANSTDTPSRPRAAALNWAGRLATVNGEPDDLRLLEASVEMARLLDDRELLALGLRHLAWAAKSRGDEASVRSALEAALITAREVGDRREVAFAHVSLGAVHEQAGETVAATGLLAQALPICREVGDAGPLGWALTVMGAVAIKDGRYDDAARYIGEALDVARPMGYWAVVVAALAQLGTLARAQGDLAAAFHHGRACVAAAREIGDLGLVAAAVAFFADLEFSAGRYERGTRLLAAESTWRLGLDARPAVSFWTWPMPTPDEARRQLGDAGFGCAWTAGQRMTLEQAAEDVLQDAD